MAYIYICPIEPFDEDYIDPICKSVEDTFDFPTRPLQTKFKVEIAYDYSREQYNSTILLKGLLNLVPHKALKIMGVTDVDLFVPVLTFVFGEAQLNGKAAVISTLRLKNEFYGLPRNDEIFKSRILKEVIHELGHTFGLFHCKNYNCVMNSSMYVEYIDLKTEQFCKSCRETLSKNIIQNA
jgi:archaemetzincin